MQANSHAAPAGARTSGNPRATPRLTSSRGWLAALGAAGVLAGANYVLARRSEARHPPRGRIIEVDGVKLQVLEEGVGPPLVLLHGNGVSLEDFHVSGLCQALASAYRVISFDRPGFGYSQRPRKTIWTAEAQAGLIQAALERLKVQRPVVVAHSWGCFVALQMALRKPGSVAGLVLISGYYRPTFWADAALSAGPALPVIGDLMRYTVSPPLSRLLTPFILRRLFAPAPVSEAFKANYPISTSLRPWQLRASAAEAGMMTSEAAQIAKQAPRLTTVPMLLIAGRDDKLISFEHQTAWLAETLPHARLLAIPGAGHMVHHTATPAVLDAIVAFASELTSGPAALASQSRAPAHALAQR